MTKSDGTEKGKALAMAPSTSTRGPEIMGVCLASTRLSVSSRASRRGSSFAVVPQIGDAALAQRRATQLAQSKAELLLTVAHQIQLPVLERLRGVLDAARHLAHAVLLILHAQPLCLLLDATTLRHHVQLIASIVRQGLTLQIQQVCCRASLVLKQLLNL